MKICKNCNIEKDLNSFPKSKSHRLGVKNICKSCNNEYNKKHYIQNKEKINKKHKEYRENNIEIEKVRHENYRLANKKKVSEYHKIRKLTDIKYKLSCNIRSLVSNSIRKMNYSKNSKTFNILGCSFNDFKKYLESKWEPWMNWNNYGKYNGTENFGWDIDHIIPTSSAKSEHDILNINHYKNLQPLCSKINRYEKRNIIKTK